MKRKTAKETLAESFREIAEKKPADRITVMDIAENCGYSTTTFYRHFRDKYDLMAWEYTRGVEEILDKTGRGEAGWRQACAECARLFAGRKAYLKNLLLNTGGYDSFLRYMLNIHYDGLKKALLKASGADAPDVRTEMCLRAYCHGAVDISCGFILGQYDITEEELAEAYTDSLPPLLEKYLLRDG